jgi:hypothetical protein
LARLVECLDVRDCDHWRPPERRPRAECDLNVLTACALGIAGRWTGINIFSADRIEATIAVMILEMIPGISVVPAWTIRVYFAKKAAQAQKEA